MPNVITPTTSIAYFLTDGTVRDKSGDSNFHPGSTENQIIVYVEDGDVNNVMTINYNPDIRKRWASHWFPLHYRGLVEHTLDGESEPRTFAQYQTKMPSIVSSMNINSDSTMGVDITVRQQAGNNLIGAYATVASLPTSYGDWLDLQDLNENDVVAYVYEAGVNGFYMVEYVVDTYTWVLQTSGITNYVSAKPYDVWECTVLAGYNNPAEITELTDEQYRLIWQELGQLSGYYDSNYDLIQDLIDGTTPVGKAVADQNGNVINTTYQLLSNLVTAFQTTPDDTHYASEKLIYDTIQAILDGTTPFTRVKIDDGSGNYVLIDYIHTDGNNYQVLQITYPDGRVAQIDEEFYNNFRNETGITLNSGHVLMTSGVTTGNQAVKGLLFDEDSEYSHNLVGTVTVDGIADNAKSKATFLGIVSSIASTNLYSSGTAYAEGQVVYARGGKLSNVAPDKPSRQVRMGIIINVVSTNYDVLLCPKVFDFLGELSNVSISTIADQDGIKYDEATQTFVPDNRTTALVTANMVKSVSWNGTTFIITFTHYDNTTSTVEITLAQLKAFIGVATDSLNGLMSATDKSRLDTIYALINDQADDDANSVVDTVGEVLQIFNQYPEGADLVTALAAKVDKVTGKSLVLDTLITKLTDLYTQAELIVLFNSKTDKTLTIAGIDLSDNISQAELLVALALNNVDNTSDLNKPISTATQTALDLKRNNDPTALNPLTSTTVDTDDLIDVYVVATGELKKMTIAEHLALVAAGTTTFVNTANYMSYGMGAYKSAVLTLHTGILNTGAQVYVNIKTVDQSQIYTILMPTISSTNDLELSVDNQVAYYDVLFDDQNVQGVDLSDTVIRVTFDGTQFNLFEAPSLVKNVAYTGADGQHTIGANGIGHAITKKANTAPTDIRGRTIEQLVSNYGNPFTTTTGWTIYSATLSVASDLLVVTGTATDQINRAIVSCGVNKNGQTFYVKVRARVTDSDCQKIIIRIADDNTIEQATPTINTWYDISGVHTTDTSGVLVELEPTAQYADSATAENKVMQIAYVQVIPLPSDITTVAQAEAMLDGTILSQGLHSVGESRVYAVADYPQEIQDYIEADGTVAGDTIQGVYTLTTGKNKLIPSYGSITQNGVTIQSVGNNEYIINGTPSIATRVGIVGEFDYQTSTALMFENAKRVDTLNKNYVLSANYVSGTTSNTTSLLALLNDSVSAELTLSLTNSNQEGTYLSTIDGGVLYFYCDASTTFTNYRIKVQLELGTVATAYEPYEYSVQHTDGVLYGIGGVYDDENTQRFDRDYNDVVQSATSWSVDTLTNTVRFYKNLSSTLGYKVPSTPIVSNIKGVINNVILTATASSGSLDYPLVFIFTDGSIYFRVTKAEIDAYSSLPGTYTTTQVEEYLSAVNVEITYELATYLPRTIDNANLIPINGTHIVSPYSTWHSYGGGLVPQFDMESAYSLAGAYDINVDTDIVQGKVLTNHESRLSKVEQDITNLNIGQSDDLRFPIVTLQSIATSPDFDATNIALLFPQNNTTEYVFIIAQMPHDREPDSDIWPHVHCRLEGSGQPVFKIDYKWYNKSGETIPASFTTYTMDVNTATWSTGTISNRIFGSAAIDGTGKNESSIMLIKLYRDDNVYSGDLKVDEFDIHYTRSRFGSNN